MYLYICIRLGMGGRAPPTQPFSVCVGWVGGMSPPPAQSFFVILGWVGGGVRDLRSLRLCCSLRSPRSLRSLGSLSSPLLAHSRQAMMNELIG